MVESHTAGDIIGCVLAAIDMTSSSRRVLLHGAALARLFSTRLQVLHVGVDTSLQERERVLEFCALHSPYEVDVSDDDIILGTGLVSEAIHREAIEQKARLVVVGSRGHGRLATFLLGSTTEALLRHAPAPILMVPPINFDIVDLADRARLSCGPVLAAVDLSDANDHQLQVAGELAQLAGQPLLLLAVTGRGVTDRVSNDKLRDRAHRAAVMPHAMIVRHGDIAEEISRCAVTERIGLVVMGLRATSRQPAGAIASAVFRTNTAFVLAVPDAGAISAAHHPDG